MDPRTDSDPEFLGDFKVVARLGSGGFGKVYYCERGLDRAAVKVIQYQDGEPAAIQETRFRREVEAHRLVKSEFIPKVIDFDLNHHPMWFATEYFSGWTLASWLLNEGPVSDANFLYLASSLNRALHDLHRANLLHRDVKPQNIVMSENRLALIDLGIAKDLTQQTVFGGLVGTIPYMAPELLRGQVSSSETDYFALGVTLYELYFGKQPWGYGTTDEIRDRILESKFDIPQETPDLIRRIIQGLLHIDADTRLDYRRLTALLAFGQKQIDNADLFTQVQRIEATKLDPRIVHPQFHGQKYSSKAVQGGVLAKSKSKSTIVGLVSVALLIAVGFLGTRMVVSANGVASEQLPAPQVTVIKSQPATVVTVAPKPAPTVTVIESQNDTNYADWTYFMSPKQNIFCQFNSDYSDVRCDLLVYNGKVPNSFKNECDSWSNTSFAMASDGPGHWNCVSNSIADLSWHVLPYYQPVTQNGVTCELNPKEMYCYNEAGYEMHVNRGRATFS